ncbi:hypothetical protein GCM10009662_29360 [Catellatospora coxensis]|uniref:Uncharacterized protein n=1 Tax=Catellatospora coxensis TaxID=310354 RepID=A0A8J3L387_9ACTN|nr:hypothetical protein Cco03nite_76780 [Catellatospora coxensis]
MSGDAAVEVVWEPSAEDLTEGRVPLWWTVGPAGELGVLFVDRGKLRQSPYVKGWVGWTPESVCDGLLVTRHADGSMQRQAIGAIPTGTSHIAFLPDARLVLVEGRVPRGEPGSWPPNAMVLSAEGEQQVAFCIGDDIDVAVTDRGGSIWTAYGDEGIYGGHPQSAAGLAGWGDRGQVVWAPGGRLPEWPLAGFAAATERDQVWLAWYSSSREGHTFLTRIVPLTGEVTSWRSPVRSPDGLAVRGDRAILTRRHHNKRSTEVFRAELVDDAWTVTDRREVAVPGRVVMRCGQGRDGFLWLRTGDVWLRIEA